MSPEFAKLAEENNKSEFTNVTDILLKILDNILKAPDNAKYRKLKLSNEIVCGTILPSEGAAECLYYFGFELVDEAFVMPQTVSVTRLQTARDELLAIKKAYTPQSGTNASATKYRSPFLEEIVKNSKLVLLYEKNELRAAATSRIPFDELNQRLKKKKGTQTDEFETEFGLLHELMIWFKDEFFSWMDSPPCQDCNNSEPKFQGFSHDPRDFVYTDRVEVYVCDRCGKRLLFPRYNNPAILLKTRTGRCGEWANCFTLMCRASGYDARLVVDRTDHVWTEVYSNTQKRWIHCDPCEGTIDTPLQYELGWGKKLTYVIAFSKDEVQDVTWRYTVQFEQVRARRKEGTEAALLACIMYFSEKLQSSLSEEQKRYLKIRRLLECVEFLMPQHSDKQYAGRASGSLQWRLSRNECTSEPNRYTWTLNSTEMKQRRLQIRYSTAQDKYYRGGTDETIAGWANATFESVSVFRKVERDWKMCYLCRVEGADSGSIKWKFNFKQTGLVIGRIKLRYQCALYQTGVVNMILCNEDTCVRLDPKKSECETTEFHGSTELSLSAVMDGGDGSTAWQHAQLFRQSIEDTDCPLEIDILLEPAKPSEDD